MERARKNPAFLFAPRSSGRKSETARRIAGRPTVSRPRPDRDEVVPAVRPPMPGHGVPRIARLGAAFFERKTFVYQADYVSGPPPLSGDRPGDDAVTSNPKRTPRRLQKKRNRLRIVVLVVRSFTGVFAARVWAGGVFCFPRVIPFVEHATLYAMFIRRVCFVPQDQPRPPVYNVEDYAGALRKFGKRGQAPADGDPSAEPKHTEMTLKEFTSTTELLDKLKADLKLAYFRYKPCHNTPSVFGFLATGSLLVLLVVYCFRSQVFSQNSENPIFPMYQFEIIILLVFIGTPRYSVTPERITLLVTTGQLSTMGISVLFAFSVLCT